MSFLLVFLKISSIHHQGQNVKKDTLRLSMNQMFWPLGT